LIDADYSHEHTSQSVEHETIDDDQFVSDNVFKQPEVICVDTTGVTTPPGDCDQTNGENVQSNVSDDDDDCVVGEESDVNCLASGNVVADEQRADVTLKGCFKLAEKGKGRFVVCEGLLYHQDRILGQDVSQLVVPESRRKYVLQMGHDTHGGHMGTKRTRARIAYTFFWPTLTADCKEYMKTCRVCQLKKRETCQDRVPIHAIPRADKVFDHWYCDLMEPFYSGEGPKPVYNYAFVAIDSYSRFPVCYLLKSVHAKSVCDALLSLWQFTGCASYLSSDRGSCFTSQLTQEFERRFGCSPRFNSPYQPNSTGLVERAVGNVKTIVSKLAMDHPSSWHTYIPSVMWALRESTKATTGVAPWTLVMGYLPKGPLAILKDSWLENAQLPVSFGKNNDAYLRDLHEKLKVARDYTLSHSEREQEKYVSHYNLRSKDKHFQVGDQVLILTPDSTASKAFSKWIGPAEVVAVRSPYSYLVEHNNVRRHYHANKLCKYHVRVESITCEPVVCDFFVPVNEVVVDSDVLTTSTCAVVYEDDRDFGHIDPIPENLCPPEEVQLPSKQIDGESLKHLSPEQQTELLCILDKYHEIFSDKPGYTDVVTHRILLKEGFKPRRLAAYRVPEKLKVEVDRQIENKLTNGIIRKSSSPMVSPLVCVLKGKDGCNGVRLAVDYRYVNSFTFDDCYPLPDLQCFSTCWFEQCDQCM